MVALISMLSQGGKKWQRIAQAKDMPELMLRLVVSESDEIPWTTTVQLIVDELSLKAQSELMRPPYNIPVLELPARN